MPTGTGTEVGLDDPRVLLDLLGQAFGDHLAVVEHRDPVGETHDDLHVVLDQQDGDATVADLAHEVAQTVLLDRVHPGGRLVEQQELRLRTQGAGDLEATLVSVARGSCRDRWRTRLMPQYSSSSRARSSPSHFLLLVTRAAEHGAEDARLVPGIDTDEHVLERGHVREQPDLLERPADTDVDDLVRALPGDRSPAERHLTLGRV